MSLNTALYELVTTWHGGMASQTCSRASISGAADTVPQLHLIDSDEPVTLGGEGFSPTPQELMLAAFNACMIAIFAMEARRENIALQRLEVQTCCDLITNLLSPQANDAESSHGRIQYVFHVSGSGTIYQFEQIHRKVINASLNWWILAQNLTVEGDLILH